MKRFTKILIGILFIGLFVSSCRQTEVQDKFVELVKTNCNKQEECKIKLSEITPFSWDTMYYFQMNFLNGEFEPILGQDVTFHSSDWTSKLIFLKDNRIVHKEEIPADI